MYHSDMEATHMTKNQASIQKAAWKLALAEGRVIKISEVTFKSYPTREAAQTALEALLSQGIRAEKIQTLPLLVTDDAKMITFGGATFEDCETFNKRAAVKKQAL